MARTRKANLARAQRCQRLADTIVDTLYGQDEEIFITTLAIVLSSLVAIKPPKERIEAMREFVDCVQFFVKRIDDADKAEKIERFLAKHRAANTP